MSRARGSAAVFTVAAVTLVAAIAVAVTVVAAVFLRQRQAAQSADLAALAAADKARVQPTDACAAAARLASDNGASLSRCQLDGLDVQVSTEVPVGPPARGWRVTATARAGPPQSP